MVRGGGVLGCPRHLNPPNEVALTSLLMPPPLSPFPEIHYSIPWPHFPSTARASCPKRSVAPSTPLRKTPLVRGATERVGRPRGGKGKEGEEVKEGEEGEESGSPFPAETFPLVHMAFPVHRVVHMTRNSKRASRDTGAASMDCK